MEIPLQRSYIASNSTLFQLTESVELKLTEMKAKDFYWLLIGNTYTEKQTGSKRWDKRLEIDQNSWEANFQVHQNMICKEVRLREFQFKFLHYRIVVTRKELLGFGIKEDGECLYCGDFDSIDRTLIHCHFTKVFTEKVIHWFNESNRSNFDLSTKELLFGILNSPGPSCKKINYTLLFMRYYIYKRKLNEEGLLLQDFIKRIKQKYVFEKLNVY